MYSIRCDGQLVFSPPVVNDGYVAYEATLTRELNKVDTCIFTIPAIGNGYDIIHKLTSVITVWDDDEKIFHGRCIDITEDFYKNRAHSRPSFLNESIISLISSASFAVSSFLEINAATNAGSEPLNDSSIICSLFAE